MAAPFLPTLTRDSVLDGRDVAELLHLPLSTVLEYARRGVLPGHKLGRRWVFLRDEVDAAVRAAPVRAHAGRAGGSRLNVGRNRAPFREGQMTLPINGVA